MTLVPEKLLSTWTWFPSPLSLRRVGTPREACMGVHATGGSCGLEPAEPDAPSEGFRLFNCARCRALLRVCRSCDRGQRFCLACRPLVRRANCRSYERDYRSTEKGRESNRERQRRHRERPAVITHPASPISQDPPAPSAPAPQPASPVPPEHTIARGEASAPKVMGGSGAPAQPLVTH